MAKKEKVEDINVMEGIDFKKNQRRTRRIQERLKKEKRIYRFLGIIAIMMIIILTFTILHLHQQQGYKSCVENGMSKEWCEVHTR